MSEPFKIQGADGSTVAIDAGEYYVNTKARARRMMLNSLSSEARRVYACLELATMAFRQELAVTMERGKQRPLVPSDVARQTELSKRDVRRGFEELEHAGLAKREADDGNALRRGHLRLYSWAEPRPAALVQNNEAARCRIPDWFPESWEPLKPLLKRLKLSISTDTEPEPGLLEEGEEVARCLIEAEKAAARFLKRVSAQPKKAALNKEERNERKELSPPTPSLAPAKEGNGAVKTPPLKVAKDPRPERWADFLLLAKKAGMKFTPAELPRRIKQFQELSEDEQRAAYRGIEDRLSSGQYPGYAPRLANYLFDQRWNEELDRPRSNSAPDTSWLDSYARGEVDLEKD